MFTVSFESSVAAADLDMVSPSVFGAAVLQAAKAAAKQAGDEAVDYQLEMVDKTEITLNPGSLDMSDFGTRQLFLADAQREMCFGLSQGSDCKVSLLSYRRSRELSSRALAPSVQMEVERSYSFASSPNLANTVASIITTAFGGMGVTVTQTTQTDLRVITTVTKSGAIGDTTFDETFATQDWLKAELERVLPGVSIDVSAPVVVTPPKPPPFSPPSPPNPPPTASKISDEALSILALALAIALGLAMLLILVMVASYFINRRSRAGKNRVVPISEADRQAEAPAQAAWREPQAPARNAPETPVPERSGVHDVERTEMSDVEEDTNAASAAADTLPKIAKPPALTWASNLGFQVDPATGVLTQRSGQEKLRAAMSMAAAANRIGKAPAGSGPERPAPMIQDAGTRVGQSQAILTKWKSDRSLALASGEPSGSPARRPPPLRPAPTCSGMPGSRRPPPLPLTASMQSVLTSQESSETVTSQLSADPGVAEVASRVPGGEILQNFTGLEPGFEGGGGARLAPPLLDAAATGQR
jgi:hypothetical protein